MKKIVNKLKIQVQVLDRPATFILIDSDKNPEACKTAWLLAHELTAPRAIGGYKKRKEVIPVPRVRTKFN